MRISLNQKEAQVFYLKNPEPTQVDNTRAWGNYSHIDQPNISQSLSVIRCSS
jgi:hypothetical protein